MHLEQHQLFQLWKETIQNTKKASLILKKCGKSIEDSNLWIFLQWEKFYGSFNNNNNKKITLFCPNFFFFTVFAVLETRIYHHEQSTSNGFWVDVGTRVGTCVIIPNFWCSHKCWYNRIFFQTFLIDNIIHHLLKKIYIKIFGGRIRKNYAWIAQLIIRE